MNPRFDARPEVSPNSFAGQLARAFTFISTLAATRPRFPLRVYAIGNVTRAEELFARRLAGWGSVHPFHVPPCPGDEKSCAKYMWRVKLRFFTLKEAELRMICGSSDPYDEYGIEGLVADAVGAAGGRSARSTF